MKALDSNIKFKVEVNPFTRKCVINTKIGTIQYTKILYYADKDEWSSFEMDDTIFDIHFLYDKSFSVSIHPVIRFNDVTIDTTKSYDVDLEIVLNEAKKINVWDNVTFIKGRRHK